MRKSKSPTNARTIVKSAFDEFLGNNFPGLQFHRPFITAWDVGVKFDLQPTPTVTVSPSMNDYFEAVQKKAFQIFETFATDKDKLILLLYTPKIHKRSKFRRGDFAFKQIEGFNAEDVYYSIQNLRQPEHYLMDSWIKAVIQVKTNQLNYKQLLVALSHTDFPLRKPFYQNEIYFLNLTKNTILFMYDDRGIDIIASKKEQLIPLRKAHAAWILE